MRLRASRPSRNYAAIPNALFRYEAMSSDARFLLGLMMTYSDDWEFNVDHLRRIAGWGRDKMQKVLRELQDHRYLLRQAIRDEETGRLIGTRWIIIDEPGLFSGAGPAALVTGDDGGPEMAGGGVSGGSESAGADGGSGGSGSSGKAGDGRAAALDAGAAAPDAECAEMPGNHRKPENPAVGADQAGETLKTRQPENPTVGKPGPIRRNTLKKNQEESTGSNRKPDFAATDSAGENGGSDPAGSLDGLAEFWAEVILSGRSVPSTGIKPSTARHMLKRDLVTEDQLRSAGVFF